MSNCVRDSKRTREHCLHWPVWDDETGESTDLFCCKCSLDHGDESIGKHIE